jgi:hypothetical protein
MGGGRAPTLAHLCLAAVCGCAGSPAVERVYGDRLVEGRYIEPRAYSAFLIGSLADASGDSLRAQAAYREAFRVDPAAGEVMTPGGPLRCRIEPCPAAPTRPSTRALIVARAVVAGDRVAAWEAALAWAEAQGDTALRVKALEVLVETDPVRRNAVAFAAEQLATRGATGPAWALAAAAVEASDAPLTDERALAARLAVDEAIALRDVSVVRRRATRTRVGLEEAAARAWLAGRRDFAASIAREVMRADPESLGARLVYAAADGRDTLGPMVEAHPAARAMSAAEWVVYGQALGHDVPSEAARSFLASLGHGPVLDGDDRVVRPAVELAARGIIDARVLPEGGRLELAFIGSHLPPHEGAAASFDMSALDPRHLYLALASEAPLDRRTREVGAPLQRLAPSDPVVAAAAAIVELAQGSPVDPVLARALLSRDPGDLLLAAVALRAADRTTDLQTAQAARAVLALVRPTWKSGW